MTELDRLRRAIVEDIVHRPYVLNADGTLDSIIPAPQELIEALRALTTETPDGNPIR